MKFNSGFKGLTEYYVFLASTLDRVGSRVYSPAALSPAKMPWWDQGLECLEQGKISCHWPERDLCGVRHFALSTIRLEYPGCHLIDYIQWQQSP